MQTYQGDSVNSLKATVGAMQLKIRLFFALSATMTYETFIGKNRFYMKI